MTVLGGENIVCQSLKPQKVPKCHTSQPHLRVPCWSIRRRSTNLGQTWREVEFQKT